MEIFGENFRQTSRRPPAERAGIRYVVWRKLYWKARGIPSPRPASPKLQRGEPTCRKQGLAAKSRGGSTQAAPAYRQADLGFLF